MKILDRYILKTYVVSLVIVLGALMGLALILDLLVNVNKFLDLSAETQDAGFLALAGSIMHYFFYKAFDFFQLLAAPAVLFAAAASLVRLNRSRELTSIKAAGISLYRVMWPMILVSLVLDGFYVVNQEMIIPRIAGELSRDPDDLEVQKAFSVDFIRDEHNNIIYAPVYDPRTRTMHEQLVLKCPECGGVFERADEPAPGTTFPCPHCQAALKAETTPIIFHARLRVFMRDSKYEATGTIEAERATWDAARSRWTLVGGILKPPINQPVLLDRAPTEPEGYPTPHYSTNIGPEDILRHRSSEFHRYMAYKDLEALATDPMRGNRRQLQVSMHQHVTSPVMNILLLLLGLPFVAGRDDRNYFISIGVAFMLVIGVFTLTFASTAFGNAGHISPLLAAWIPVFVVLPASVLSMEALRT
jgi:lipopolysaccharide export system permease protein